MSNINLDGLLVYKNFSSFTVLVLKIDNNDKKLLILDKDKIILDEIINENKVIISLFPYSLFPKIDTMKMIHNGDHIKLNNSKYGYNIGLMLINILKDAFNDSINIKVFKRLQNFFVNVVCFFSLNHSSIDEKLITTLDKFMLVIKMLPKTYNLDEKNTKYIKNIVDLVRTNISKIISSSTLEDGYLYEVIFLITNIDKFINNGYVYFTKNKLYIYHNDNFNCQTELTFNI